jgi:nitrate reductase (NAD(P)H)
LDGGIIAKANDGQGTDTQASFLSPKHWRSSKLVGKTQLSHDSAMFRFALDRPDQQIGLPIGQHVYVRVKDADGNFVQRAYTPFSGNELLGYLDILIKVYPPSAQYPLGGKMTNLLDSLRVDEDCIEMKGPLGHFTYEQGSKMRIHKHPPRRIRNVAMIAGGSGITPIWSTLKGLLEDEEAVDTRIWILNANRTEADILARAQIDQLIARRHGSPNPIKLWHILSSNELDEGWTMGRGRVNVACMREHLPPAPVAIDDKDGHPTEDTIALLCGPPAMEEVVLQGLQELGWDISRNVVRF